MLKKKYDLVAIHIYILKLFLLTHVKLSITKIRPAHQHLTLSVRYSIDIPKDSLPSKKIGRDRCAEIFHGLSGSSPFFLREEEIK